MYHRHTSSRLCPIVAALLALFLWAGQPETKGQSVSPGIDFFSGVDFNFRDINFKTQYEFLIRLTPGFKWNFGDHWQVSGMAFVPIVNQYGDAYKHVEPGMLNISKELRLSNLYLKATAGAFSQHRYGLDLKAFLPLCSWFAFEGQVGWIGQMYIYPEWEIIPMDRYAWTAGGDIYLSQWNTQLRGIVGKYLYQDFGGEVEAIRHFNHTSVSIYGRWNNFDGFDAGFKFVAMLPPYHRTHRAVNFRPASNFRLPYTVMYHQYTNRMYRTDPEENERDGWFSRDLLQWGSHTMEPDFIITEKKKGNETP